MEEVALLLEKVGQSHLLQFSKAWSESDRDAFIKQLKETDVTDACEAFKKCSAGDDGAVIAKGEMRPIPSENCGSVNELSPNILEAYNSQGLAAVAEGRVGVVLLAGGQGTRLGVAYPKGQYDVGLPSRKSLFQLQAERILKLQRLAADRHPDANARIVWYIMTSHATRAATESFFSENDNFGLQQSQVVFFNQGQLPCFGFDGKILMDSKYSMALAPDGNGGMYRGVVRSGALADMEARGLRFLHVYCVDNVLVKVADPVFVGFCVAHGADCGAKVVERTDPKEPIGVICELGGAGTHVVEYSEIPDRLAARADAARPDKLAFRAGNIANHFLTLPFLARVAREEEGRLQHHVAKKKIPHLSDDGETLIKPTIPNGIKMEKFIFDVFQFSRKFVCWEVRREEEFSPLKNADSANVDCPKSCREDVYKLHRRWLGAAGARFQPHQSLELEIAPAVSYSGEGLDGLKDKVLQLPCHLDVDTISKLT